MDSEAILPKSDIVDLTPPPDLLSPIMVDADTAAILDAFKDNKFTTAEEIAEKTRLGLAVVMTILTTLARAGHVSAFSYPGNKEQAIWH